MNLLMLPFRFHHERVIRLSPHLWFLFFLIVSWAFLRRAKTQDYYKFIPQNRASVLVFHTLEGPDPNLDAETERRQ
jgi:hypothetical protein